MSFPFVYDWHSPRESGGVFVNTQTMLLNNRIDNVDDVSLDAVALIFYKASKTERIVRWQGPWYPAKFKQKRQNAISSQSSSFLGFWSMALCTRNVCPASVRLANRCWIDTVQDPEMSLMSYACDGLECRYSFLMGIGWRCGVGTRAVACSGRHVGRWR